MPFHCADDNELILENLNISVSKDLAIIPGQRFNEFVDECNAISNDLSEKDDRNLQEDLSNSINSRYLDIPQFNQIKPDPVSSLGILHTNIASISKHFDDLTTVLSLLKFNFQIIGISEHKIHKSSESSISNIDLKGYHPFVFGSSETTHGGTGFFIHESLVFIKRDDLKFNSAGNYESTFIELILPNRKNVILGCIYRHPTSTIPVHRFTNDYIVPLLENIC